MSLNTSRELCAGRKEKKQGLCKKHTVKVLKMKQTEKVFGIINIKVHLIGILRLFDVLQNDIIGYFKYLNSKKLSSESLNSCKVMV